MAEKQKLGGVDHGARSTKYKIHQCCNHTYNGDNAQGEEELYLQSPIPGIVHTQLLRQKPGSHECCGVKATF